MDWVFFSLLACCVIALPVVARRQGWQPALLFMSCALVYAVFGALAALFLTTTIPMATSAGPAVADAYYIVSGFYTYLNTAIFLLVPAALLWVQQKLTPKVFLGLSHWLFWVINLGLLVDFFAQKVVMYFIRPRRYVDYESAFKSVAMVSDWVTKIVQLSALAVVLLFAASLTLRIARHFRPS